MVRPLVNSCTIVIPTNHPRFLAALQAVGFVEKHMLYDIDGKQMGVGSVFFQEMYVSNQYADSKFQAQGRPSEANIDKTTGNPKKARKEGSSRGIIGAQEIALIPNGDEMYRILGSIINPSMANVEKQPLCVVCDRVAYVAIAMRSTESSEHYTVNCRTCKGQWVFDQNYNILSTTDGSNFGVIDIRKSAINYMNYLEMFGIDTYIGTRTVEVSSKMTSRSFEDIPDVL